MKLKPTITFFSSLTLKLLFMELVSVTLEVDSFYTINFKDSKFSWPVNS